MSLKSKIGIIDADLLDNGTRHPNLALMKISGYYKGLGHDVKLISKYSDVIGFDQLFMSKVFNFTKVDESILSLPNLKIGGTGFYDDGGENLPDEIEHHFPDYTLYNEYIDEQISLGKKKSYFSDYIDYSIGFATRGCFRKCAFCVNQKYDKTQYHAHIKEFLDDSRKAIYLWDDNIFAYGEWEKVFDELDEIGKPFQFRQGLDIRLMTEKKAKRLAASKYNGDIIFAFDHIKDREIIEKNIRLWKRYCNKATKLYVLCAFDSQDSIDIANTFERIAILMKLGCLPYIMRYEKYKDSPYQSLYTQLARWCNQPQFFKKKSFRQFCEANQLYHKNEDTRCSAYQSMLDFENEYPNIAVKYFDLRYDEENEYLLQYGYGRKYCNKPDCELCEQNDSTWMNAINGVISESNIIQSYYTKEIDLQCLKYKSAKCVEKTPEEIASWLIAVISRHSIDDIFSLITSSNSRENIDASNIPQLSKLDAATEEIPKILMESGLEPFSFKGLAYYLDGSGNGEFAKMKYGENHAKLATLLDLASITFPRNSAEVGKSILLKEYYKLNKNNRNNLICKLILRIPIIQTILCEASLGKINPEILLETVLSHTTQERRSSSLKTLLKVLRQSDSTEINSILDNVEWGK